MTEYAWMTAAKSHLGLKETPGKVNNPTIMGWAKALGQASTYTSDEVSWCGLFVGAMIREAKLTDPLPKNPLGARQWLTFGAATQPGVGAILVFWRGEKAGWLGHVGFYVGEDAQSYHVLGGNQSDSVSITKVLKSRLLGARAPKSVPFTPKKVITTLAGSVSTNEA